MYFKCKFYDTTHFFQLLKVNFQTLIFWHEFFQHIYSTSQFYNHSYSLFNLIINNNCVLNFEILYYKKIIQFKYEIDISILFFSRSNQTNQANNIQKKESVKDSQQNTFTLANQFQSFDDVKVKDVLASFPMLKYQSNYHVRFKTICQEIDVKMTAWIDISNLNARVPVVNNTIHMKVLQLPENVESKIIQKFKQLNDQTSNAQKPDVNKQVLQSQNQSTQNKQQVNQQEDLMQMSFVKDEPKQQFQQQTSFKQDLMYMNQAPVKQNISRNHTLMEDAENVQLSELEKAKIQENVDEKVKKLFRSSKAKQLRKQWDDEDQKNNMRFKAAEELEEKILQWAKKETQRNDLRTLLCTVHNILWEESGWKQCSIGSLLNENQVKKQYMLVLRIVHPDKNQNKDYRQRYLSERIFFELNQAWSDYQSKK